MKFGIENLIEQSERWHKSINETFQYTSSYDKWKLLVDEEVLYRVDLYKRKEFVEKLMLACIDSSWKFSSIYPTIIWCYCICSDDVDVKLNEFKNKMILAKEDIFKGCFKVNKYGEIEYTLS